MPKVQRDAVVSVRLSRDEQEKLRGLATERGTTVSELVRSAAVREVAGPTPHAGPGQGARTSSGAEPASTTNGTQNPTVNQGMFWDIPGLAETGQTLHLRR
jgi:hypothetical protein